MGTVADAETRTVTKSWAGGGGFRNGLHFYENWIVYLAGRCVHATWRYYAAVVSGTGAIESDDTPRHSAISSSSHSSGESLLRVGNNLHTAWRNADCCA